MRKEFKFRVFHPELNKFVYFDLGGFDYSDRYLDQKNYPVQQYTGFVDNKNKPIYEGDIVKAAPLILGTNVFEYTCGEIVWINGKFCISQKDVGMLDLSDYLFNNDFSDEMIYSLEVIGNIIWPPFGLHVS